MSTHDVVSMNLVPWSHRQFNVSNCYVSYRLAFTHQDMDSRNCMTAYTSQF